jgi:hypothetical protein
MVVKGESPRSGAKMPDGNTYGGCSGFFNSEEGMGMNGEAEFGEGVVGASLLAMQALRLYW